MTGSGTVFGARLREAAASSSGAFRIPRRNDAGPAPLSFAERRLWFLDRFEPGNPAYNVGMAVRFNGRFDGTALERSLAEIVRRHEILRTSFPEAEGEPCQRVAASSSLELPLVDLSGLALEQREEEARRLAAEEARRPFDLRDGPLLRCALMRLGAEKHILLLLMHHVICDGWSLGVFVGELCALYEAFSRGRPSPLPELPVQYADFAVWQRGWLQGEVRERLLSYWKARLAGPLPALELPADRPRPPVQSYRGARESLLLSRALRESLRALGLREGATLFMTLLAAFQVLLHRYTGEADILVGSPIANRNRTEIEGMIGFFVNTLVLRTDLSGDPSFRDLLSRVREVAVGAYAHQDLPFEMLVEELRPEREMSRPPLFQVIFSLQNVPMPAVELPGLSVSLLRIDNRTSKFDLSMILVETEEGLQATAEYNTDLFDTETVSRTLRNYRTLLEGIAASPERRISELPLLTEAERRRLLVEWNDTRVDGSERRCIHQFFEAQAEESPDAIAVVSGEERLTYRELNRRANRLAHDLKLRAVGPEVLVGICMERSLEMVVGLLAILKAGGAYVPLDPTYPKERLSFMLEDTRAPLMLTQKRLADVIPPFSGEILFLPAASEAVGRESDEAPASRVTPANLAYVIYTSGSTGKPKGVMISHGALRNHMLWMRQAFPLTAADRVLQRTSASFDASVPEFYAPLLAGARLVMAGPEGHRDSRDIVETIARERITIVHVVPALLRTLLDEPNLESCRSLRRVFSGASPLTSELQEGFFARLSAELVNLYGPTEVTIDATFWTCQRESPPRVVPIGRPEANTLAYILDRYGNPVPIGVPGELYIGGEGVARGYWRRPELTAESFIPDSFRKEPGARLYKTGDLARYLSDGNIEFLGRLDDQVKVRGLRVELGEVEAVLSEHPLVKECVVVWEEGSGEGRLVGYVVFGREAAAPQDLRRHLKEKLPEQMVPSAFVVLPALPRGPSRKIDRRALPAPEPGRGESVGGYVAPRDALEGQLVKIWEDVLRVQPIGVRDDFFELGGHSLLATRIVSRLRRAAGIDLPLRDLFENSTVAALAGVIEGRSRAGSPATIER